MNPSDPPRHGSSGRGRTLLLTLVLTLALAGGYWYLTHRATSVTQTSMQFTAFAAWPTAPATFTPIIVPTATTVRIPTATATFAPPTPTPIVINTEEISELSTMAVTLSTTQFITGAEAKPLGIPTAWINGLDSVTVEYIAKVKLGIQVHQVTFSSSASTVIVTLPAIEVLSVTPDWNQSRIISSTSRIIGKDQVGLETQAWQKAQAAIKSHVIQDDDLLDSARKLTQLQIENYLHQLGFTSVFFQ